MNEYIKIHLLKRKFSSIEYLEDFINTYQLFIDHSLSALDQYKNVKKQKTITPNRDMDIDEKLWDEKVKPNFLRMYRSSQTAIEKARLGDLSAIRSLAADFKGLSKSMDGVRESFMDTLEPEIKKTYFSLWKRNRVTAGNIVDTINNWWKDDEILDEEITGPVDEVNLLNYLKPGEQV